MKRLGELALTGLLCLALTPPLLAQQDAQPPAIPPILEGNRPLAYPESKHPEGPTAETEKPATQQTVKPGRQTRPTPKVSSKKKGKKTTVSGKKTSPKSGRKKGVATTRGASARNT